MQSIPTLGVSNPIFTVCSWASTRKKELSFYFLSIASAAVTRLVISWCEMHNSRRESRGDLREREEWTNLSKKRVEKRNMKITDIFSSILHIESFHLPERLIISRFLKPVQIFEVPNLNHNALLETGYSGTDLSFTLPVFLICATGKSDPSPSHSVLYHLKRHPYLRRKTISRPLTVKGPIFL